MERKGEREGGKGQERQRGREIFSLKKGITVICGHMDEQAGHYAT